MKHLPLLVANLLRRKLRTILTIGSFAVAVFLFCLLYTVRDAFNQGIDVAGADRLLVINRVSLVQPLPRAYAERIQRVPGVVALSSASWFGGIYKDARNFFPQFAIEPDTYRGIYSEFLVPDDQWAEFLKDKAGAVVGKATVERFGWKLGDRIPIQGAIYPGLWEFNLRGIYTGKRPNDDLTQFWFRGDYLYEKSPDFIRGYVGWYAVRVGDGQQPLAVTKAIDALFANSAYETRTQTEQALAASFVQQMGNIQALLLTIGTVVVATLLLVTGNTLATAVRERTGELAVLKTLGYTDRFVMSLVLAEGGALALLGGMIGVGLAKLFTLRGDPTGGMLASFYLAPSGMLLAFGAVFAIALVAALAPALAARRLRVIEALRRL